MSRRGEIPSSDRIARESDSKWPQKNKDGRQELEIKIGGEHVSFEVRRRRAHPRCYVGEGKGGSAKKSSTTTDGQDRFARRCDRVGRPRRPPRFLLPGPGPEGSRLQLDISPLQDQAHLDGLGELLDGRGPRGGRILGHGGANLEVTMSGAKTQRIQLARASAQQLEPFSCRLKKRNS